MTLSFLTLERHPGLPPDGAAGQFWGFDASGGWWLMMWSAFHNDFRILGFSDRRLDMADLMNAHTRDKPAEPFIVSHAKLPTGRE